MSDAETIRQALERAERTVTLKPERGQRTTRNTAVLTEGLTCRVQEGERSLTLDVGRALGGADLGPNPSMLLRSALSGCVAIGVKQWAARMGVPVDAVEVVLETDTDARGQLGLCPGIAPGFGAIRLAIAVRSPASVQSVEAAVATSLDCSPLIDVFTRVNAVGHQVSVSAAHRVEEV